MTQLTLHHGEARIYLSMAVLKNIYVRHCKYQFYLRAVLRPQFSSYPAGRHRFYGSLKYYQNNSLANFLSITGRNFC
jgi:hypothetical protein